MDFNGQPLIVVWEVTQACEFRKVYGGSRSRAYALNSDIFEVDPSCVYQLQAVQVGA